MYNSELKVAVANLQKKFNPDVMTHRRIGGTVCTKLPRITCNGKLIRHGDKFRPLCLTKDGQVQEINSKYLRKLRG